MNRTQQILLALLIVQVAIAAFVYFPRRAVLPSEPLLKDYKADNVVQLNIEDSQKKSLTLKKEDGAWKLLLASGELYPTEGNKVQDALGKLEKIKTDRLITKTTGSHKQLKVAEQDFVRKLTMTTKDDKTYVLYLGTQTGTQTLHVRLEGANEVYLASDLDSYEFNASASSWIDTTYIKLASNDDVSELSVKNEHGSFTITKDANGEWKVKELGDQPLDKDKITTLLNHLNSMQMEVPLGTKEKPEYKMASPVAVVTFKGKVNDKVGDYTLTIGGKEKEGDQEYITKFSGSDWYAKVDEFFVKDFVEYTKESFIKQEPTPTPSQ